MSSSLAGADNPYYIFNKGGIQKVKDGKQYSITDEEYRKENPFHKDVGCEECIFIRDKKTLLLYVISRELIENADRKPVFCGKFTMPEWKGHANFYIFRCPFCKHVAIDYTHGYRKGCIFLGCDECHYEIILHPRKYRNIYVRENMVIPRLPLLIERIKKIFVARK